MGLDGSARARRAIDPVARLAPGRGSQVSVVCVLEPIRIPSLGLLLAVGEARAGLLVIGARGIGGVDRLLLGSVADGGIQHAPVSVLVAR